LLCRNRFKRRLAGALGAVGRTHAIWFSFHEMTREVKCSAADKYVESKFMYMRNMDKITKAQIGIVNEILDMFDLDVEV